MRGVRFGWRGARGLVAADGAVRGFAVGMAAGIYRAMPTSANSSAAAPNDADAGRSLLSVRITPNDSLGARGVVVVMVLLSAVAVPFGLLFLTLGAWPVVPFIGLDVLLLYVAFRAYRRRTSAYEEVRVTPEEVLVRSVDERGRAREQRFNTAWVRTGREVLPDDGGLSAFYILWQGRRHTLASYLSGPERADFAEAFDRAVASARRPG